MSDILDILMTGRDLVIERGHCKYHSRSADGSVCATGALHLAGAAFYHGAIHTLRDAVCALYPERILPLSSPCLAIMSFNDHPDTTPGEVIDVFDYAIACEKEKLALGNEGQR